MDVPFTAFVPPIAALGLKPGGRAVFEAAGQPVPRDDPGAAPPACAAGWRHRALRAVYTDRDAVILTMLP